MIFGKGAVNEEVEFAANEDGEAERSAIIASMEPLHISEADAVRDLAAILERVRAGAEVVIERDAQPFAIIRAAPPPRRTISECIALAEAHEREAGYVPVLDPDTTSHPKFAARWHSRSFRSTLSLVMPQKKTMPPLPESNESELARFKRLAKAILAVPKSEIATVNNGVDGPYAGTGSCTTGSRKAKRRN